MFGARSLLTALVATAAFIGAAASPTAGGSAAGPLNGFRSVLAQLSSSNSQDHVSSRRRFQMVSGVVTGWVEATPRRVRIVDGVESTGARWVAAYRQVRAWHSSLT